MQKVVGPDAVILVTATLFTVTVCDADTAPHDDVPVTVYVPELRTVMLAVVAPVDHKYGAAPDAVNITESP